MTQRLCRCCGGWHVLEEPWPHNCIGHFGQQKFDEAPQVIHDGCEVRSHLDGKIYTSKSELRRSYRAAGVVEIGNEAPPSPQKVKADRRAIRETIHRAFAQS